jgi:hypothetical protein
MSNEALQRTKRLLEIRNLQRQSAAAKLARAELLAREAAEAAREAENRLHDTALAALFAGERSLDDLLNARASFALTRRARDVADNAERNAQTVRAAEHGKLCAADLAVRQVEKLVEGVRFEIGVREVTKERLLTDEVAARRSRG